MSNITRFHSDRRIVIFGHTSGFVAEYEWSENPCAHKVCITAVYPLNEDFSSNPDNWVWKEWDITEFLSKSQMATINREIAKRNEELNAITANDLAANEYEESFYC